MNNNLNNEVFDEEEWEEDIDEESALNLPNYDGRIIGWGFMIFIATYSLLKYFQII